MTDTVETAVYRLQVEGQDQIDRLTKSIEGLAVAEEDATKATRTTSDELQRRIARYDPLIRAQEQYRKDLEYIQRLQETGVGTQQQINTLLATSTQRYEDAARAIEQAAVAAENLRRAQANAAAGPGQAVQAAGGASAYATQFEAAAKAQDEQVASINRLRAAMNPLEVEQGKVAAQMNVYRQALQEGKISQAEYAAAQEMGAASLRRYQGGVIDLADAHKGLNSQGQAALHSMRSMFEQLAMGAPITQALTAQMNHLTYAASGEGGIVGAFKQAGGVLASMITPTTAITAAVVALGAAALYAANAMDKLKVSSQRAISGAGQRTGTSVEDINKFVAQTASASGGTGPSEAESRKLAEGLTKDGEIVISRLHDMSTAVTGFANQTGKSVDEAVKAFIEFGKDPVKAVQAFADAFGPLNDAQQKALEDALALGDKTAALNVVIDANAAATKKAAENMTFLEGVSRRISIFQGMEPKMFLPVGLDTQIENVKKQLDALIASAENMPPGLGTAMLAADIGKATDALAKLQEQKEKINMQTLAAQMADVGAKARMATEALIPQINQIKQLELRINQLNAAQEKGVGGPDVSAALQAARNQLQALTQSADEAERYNQRVAEISKRWGDVGQAVALQLQQMQNMLPVAQAVTGAQKMAAQYAADYANELDRGRSAIEAEALASAKLEASQAAATASVLNQVHSLEQSTEMIKAQANGTEAIVASSQAYDNAIRSGASATAAAALSAATLDNYMTKAAIEADKVAQSAYDAMVAMHKGQGVFTPLDPYKLATGATGASLTSSIPVVQTAGGYYAANDPINMAIAAQQQAGTLNAQQNQTQQDAASSQMARLILNGMSPQAAAAEALKSSIDNLTNSTDNLNATNQELLSPYYTQDPRTSHIGFRSQGMASGGYVDVPGGISSNDNMIATVPVASGERIYIDPANSKRGTASGGSLTINIASPITINGNASADQFGRTLYQANQQLAKQIRTATQ
jgi:hypothetical protein